MTSSPPILTLGIVAGTLLAIGVCLLRLGRWHKRQGNELRCRQCEYRLEGISSDRCPECGGKISAATTVKGQYVRPRGMTLAGIGCVGLALAFLAQLTMSIYRTVAWYQYKPTSLVLADLRSPTQAAVSLAFSELVRRHDSGQLSKAQRSAFIDETMKEQALPRPTQFKRPWLVFLTEQFIDGRLTEAQKALFLSQAITLGITVPKAISEVDAVPYQLDCNVKAASSPFSNKELWFEVSGVKVVIDGRTVDEMKEARWCNIASLYSVMLMQASAPDGRVGMHNIELTTQVKLFAGNPNIGGRLLSSTDVSIRETFETIPKTQ